MATSLSDYHGKLVSIITTDGRNLVGGMRGHDNAINVILEGCHERVYSPEAPVENVSLGLFLIRGDNIALIGELDEIVDAERDLSGIRALPIKPLTYS